MLLEDERTLPSPEEYFSDQDVKNLFNAVQEVIDKTLPSPTIISIGQSPSYLSATSEKIRLPLQNDENASRKVISIPFSDTPDLIIEHLNTLFSLKNIFTNERLNHVRIIYDSYGLNPKNFKKRMSCMFETL